jgi:PAS domain S-box-containing protein
MKTEHTPALMKKWHILILVSGISGLLMLGGYLYYLFEARSIRESKHQEMQAIAELKINQIVQWRKERIADTKIISQSPFYVESIKRFLKNKNDSSLVYEMKNRFEPLKTEYGYRDVMLSSPGGILLLALDPQEKALSSILSSKIIEAVRNQKIIFSDFYYCSIHEQIHVDIIAPILDSHKNSIAAIIFQISPDDFLFPLIQTWPLPSKSAETLIVEKDGDSVLFLNELRWRKNTALQLRIALTSKDIPSVQAVLGYRGILEGTDYRGIPVLSDIEPIPGTPWFMVAKVDKSEIYAELQFRALLISLFTLSLILFVGVGMSHFYNSRQKNIYKELLLKEKELRRSQEEFKITLYSIGDAVITTDTNGMVCHMNPVAERLTGWKEREAQGTPSEHIFNIINEASRKKIENPVAKVLREGVIVGLANHTLLISKEGKETPIADSGAPIKSESGEMSGVVLVFRDQTEERATQKILFDSETRYRRLFESAKDGIIILDAVTGQIIDVNPFMTDMLGYSRTELLGKELWEIGQFNNIAASQRAFLELQMKEYIRFEDMPMEAKDGTFINVEFVSNVYLVDHTKVMQCNIRNITDRKKAEEALRESEAQFRNLFEYSPLGISMTGIDGTLHVNKAFCSIVGYTEEELKEKKWMDITHPEDIQKTSEATQSLLAGTRSQARLEKRYIHKNGTIVWADVSTYLQRDKENRPQYFITTVTDITEHKQAEEAILRLTKELELRVLERTSRLNETVAQLHEQNRVFVGRELRMIELKEQIAALEQKLTAGQHTKKV